MHLSWRRNPFLHLSLALARFAVISLALILHLFPGGFFFFFRVERAAVALPTFIPSRRKLIVMEMTVSVRPAESAFCGKLTRSTHDYSQLNLRDPTVARGFVFPSVKTEELAIYNWLLKWDQSFCRFVNLVSVSPSPSGSPGLAVETQVCVSKMRKRKA